MLKEFLSIAGNGLKGVFGGGGGLGARGIPSQGNFGQIFNGVGGGIPFGGGLPLGGGFPGAGGIPFGGGTPFGGLSGGGALQAFQGIQNQFGNYPSDVSEKTLKQQALAPGAVLIGSQSKPPSGQAPGLQGFAGQTNSYTFGGGGLGGFGGLGQSYFQQYGGAGLLGGLGQFQMLLSPFIALIGMVKSVFGFRRQMSSLQPVSVDPSITGYNQSIAYLNDSYVDSGFDEPRPFNAGLPSDLDPNDSGNGSYF